MKRVLGIIWVLVLLSIGLFSAQGALPTVRRAGAARPICRTSHLVQVIGDLLAARLFESSSQKGGDIALQVAKQKHRHSNGDNDIVIAGESYALGAGDAVDGNVVLLRSTGEIKGTINGDLVLIGSKATFSGTVNGDLVALASKLLNESGATANGDFVSCAAEIGNSDLLRVNGEHVAINTLSPLMPLFKETFNNLAHLRPMSPLSLISWSTALFVLVVRLMVAWIFPKTFPPTDLILRERPVSAFLIGLVMIPSVTIVSFLLLVTLVGIVALPFIALAVVILALFGEAYVCCWVGKRLAPQLAEQSYAVYVWVIIGTVMFWLLYCIPVIGLAATGLNFVLGLGTASIYLFESYRSTGQRSSTIITMRSEKDPLAHPPALALPLGGAADVAKLSKAQFLPRLAANLIDVVLLYVLLLSLHLTSGLIPVWILYRFAMFAWRSATLGEIVLNLRVQKVDGRLLTGDYSSSLIRALASLLSLVPLGLGFIWILFNRELDAWHDKISESYVVQLSPSVTPSAAAPPSGESTPPHTT